MSVLEILRLSTDEIDFWSRLRTLTAWEEVSDEPLVATVQEILADVRGRGDVALLEYTRRFDRVAADTVEDLTVDSDRL